MKYCLSLLQSYSAFCALQGKNINPHLKKMQVGEKISQIRRAKSLTQQEMAKKLGISLTAYNAIEKDETDLSISRLQQIAKVLGVHEWALLLPESGVNIIGEVKDNAGGNNGNNLFAFGDFSPEREALKAHISSLTQQVTDLQKQLQTNEAKHEKQVASLERQIEALHQLLQAGK